MLRFGAKHNYKLCLYEIFFADLSRRHAILFSGGAMLARLTRIETDSFSGDTSVRPFRWSTSDIYWKGNRHKDTAIHLLLQMMKRGGMENDLPTIRKLVGCELCKFVNMKASFQVGIPVQAI